MNGSHRQPPEVSRAIENVIPVDFNGIPPELRPLNQWMLWTYALKNGVVTKVPIEASTGKWCDPTSPSSWSPLDLARERYRQGIHAGIGLGLLGGLVALDMDKSVVNGQIIEPFKSFVQLLPTYFEYSPSRKGLRGFWIGSLPGNRRRSPANKLGIELYDTKRYVTVTGRKVPDTPSFINDIQPTLDAFYRNIFPDVQNAKTQERKVYSPRDESVSAIIERASRAKNSYKFNGLMNGNWQSLGYPSRSEAIFALCMIACYWTGGDIYKMDSIVRQSALCDEKWDSMRGSETFGEMTLRKAIELSR